MSKIGIFFGKGYEEIEALTVVDLVRRVGISIDMISITEDKSVVSAHEIEVKMDQTLSQVSFDELDMIVLPGGLEGTKNLEACEVLMEAVDEFYKKNKYIAAICAAPTILGHRGILEGRNACVYPGKEEHLEGAKVSYKEVEVSDHIITSRGMGCSIAFALAIIEVLTDQKTAQELEKKIVYMQS